MKLYIKNMVCNRCKMVVKTELERLGFNLIAVKLGVVEIKQNHIDAVTNKALILALKTHGFELLTVKKLQLTEQIKAAIIELVHYKEEAIKVNLSAYLSNKLALEYTYLSAAFSETEHCTIEKYFIEQKIERVKELIAYGEKSLSEIAYLLNYSSVAHLSAQFKKVTTQTPSAYKLSPHVKRKTLDEL